MKSGRIYVPIIVCFSIIVTLFSCRSGKQEVQRFFSDDSYWNQPIAEDAASDPRSDYWINIIDRDPSGENIGLNVDNYTIPIYEVDSRIVPFQFLKNGYKREGEDIPFKTAHSAKFDEMGVPIPEEAMPSGGLDMHMAIVDWKANLAWDMFWVKKLEDGSWMSATGMVYPLNGPGVFDPEDFDVKTGESIHGFGPGVAAGAPIIAGVIRYDEVMSGRIEHKLSGALRHVAFQEYVFPATWTDGNFEGGIPEGATLQLDPELDLEQFDLTEGEKVVARALQEYGLVIIDFSEGSTIRAEWLGGTKEKSWEGVLRGWSIPGGIKDIPVAHYRVLDVGQIQEGGDRKKEFFTSRLHLEESKPNIIYIMADDMGYADLGCFGQKDILTPAIDELAAGGMMLTRHYAGNTVCAPSRCSLMTGKHMGHAQVRGNKQVEPSGQLPLEEGTITVARLLKEAGYTTGMIGKWGLGIEHSSGDPLKQGFDYFYGYLDQVLAHNYFPEYLLRNGEREYLDNEVHYMDKDHWSKGLGSYATEKRTYSHDLFADDALSFIHRHKAAPFFLYLPVTIPHDNGEESWEERQEVPDFGIYSEKDWSKPKKGYAAMISRLDNDVQRIMELLEELELLENTIVFFTSDNGPMPHMATEEYFNSAGIYRGGKRDLYEGGIRVPMIVSWKGKIEAGSQSEHMSAFWDFLPTVCDLADIELSDETDGISYLPSLLGQKQEQHEVLYWEFSELGGAQAIRLGEWKLVRNRVISEAPGTLELYHIPDDPGEQKNLADAYPERVEELLEEINKNRTASEVFPMPGDPAF